MSMVGLNADAIRDVASQLRQQSDEVAAIRRAVDSLVDLAEQNWRGDDLRQFRQVWDQRLRHACLGLADHLGELAAVADRNVQAQVSVSSTLADSPGLSIGHHPTRPATGPIDPGFNMLRPLYDIGFGIVDQVGTFDRVGGRVWNADLEGVATRSPLWSTLLYAPKALDAFADAASGELGAGDFTRFTGETLEIGETFLKTYGTSAAGSVAGKYLGIAGAGFQVASDWGDSLEAFQNNDPAKGVYDLVHGGVAAVGVGVPGVGLGLTAWDLGVGIGTAIGTSPPAEAFQDRVAAYGDAQVGDIGTRYDGFGGVLNFVHDSAAVGVDDGAHFAADAMDFVGSIFK